MQPASDEIAVDLRILTARRYDLTADRTRAINRLRDQILEPTRTTTRSTQTRPRENPHQQKSTKRATQRATNCPMVCPTETGPLRIPPDTTTAKRSSRRLHDPPGPGGEVAGGR